MKITTYKQLNELVAKELGCKYDYPYSRSLLHNQILVNYIHSLDLELCIYSNKLNCYASILEMKDDVEINNFWHSTCGLATKHTTIDSNINFVPLAICLTFLKYKGIEVELKIDGTI